MSTALQALSVFLPVAYGAAASLHIAHFGNPASPLGERLRRAAVFSAIALHLGLFTVTWRVHGSFPVDDPWSALSGIAFGLGFLHFATTRFIVNPGTGAVVLSIVMGMQLLASAFGSLEEPPVEVQPGAFTLFHSFISMVAASAIGLSGINGGLYLFLFRRMQRRHFDAISRGLPSLETLAVLTRRAALGGFVLLTVGVNVGIGWAHANDVEGFHYGDPWVLAILVIWVHFGLVAFSKRVPGFSARRASWAAAMGLSVLLAMGLFSVFPSVSFHWGG